MTALINPFWKALRRNAVGFNLKAYLSSYVTCGGLTMAKSVVYLAQKSLVQLLRA